MKIEFRESFLKDLRSIKEKQLLTTIKETIEVVESASSLADIAGIKKMRGGKDYFRIRLGDYRIGLKLQNNAFVFVRFLHRKEIYRYFP